MGARAIIAVIALYGLLLQGILAGLTSHGAMAAAGSEICAPGQDHGAPDGKAPAAHRVDCCPAAVLRAGAVPPEAAFGPVEWFSRHATPVLWSAAETLLPTGPPTASHSPRGPPTV